MLKIKNKFKNISCHPFVTFGLFSIGIILLSFVLNIVHMGSSYTIVDSLANDTNIKNIYVQNLLNNGSFINVIITSFENLFAFKYFAYLFISIFCYSLLQTSGYLNVLFSKISKVNKFIVNLFIIILSMSSTLIGDFSFVFLIPLVASYYKYDKQNPIIGVITVFASSTFSYTINLFCGFIDYNLASMSNGVTNYIEEGTHISVLSTLYVSIFATIIMAIVFAVILKKYKFKKITYEVDEELVNNEITSTEKQETKSFIRSNIIIMIGFILFIYGIIPFLPLSGYFLNMNKPYYYNQLFTNQNIIIDGLIFIIFMTCLIVSYVFGKTTNKFNNYSSFLKNVANNMHGLKYAMITMLSYCLFINLYEKSNIGDVLVCILGEVLSKINFIGLPLIIILLLFVIISGFIMPQIYTKWLYLSPILIQKSNVSNLSSQFALLIYKFGDNVTKGISPFFGAFIIYLIYLNIYSDKNNIIGIRKSISYLKPFFIASVIVYIIILIIAYTLSVPLGPGTNVIS